MSALPFRWRLAPWFALALSIASTAGAALMLREREQARARERFEREAMALRWRIEQRIDNYVTLLHGTVGFFASSVQVEPREFRRYAESLGLPASFPGIRGIGLSVRVLPRDLTSFVDEQRRFNPSFHLWPAGNRAEYASIVLLEPFTASNSVALGYDMLSEPVRKAAIESARDSGLPAVTTRLTLLRYPGEREQAGFIVYVPLYALPGTPPSLQERRALIRGYAYIPFRADDLLAGILGPAAPLAIQVYDALGAPMLSGGVPGDDGGTALPLHVAGSVWKLRIAQPRDPSPWSASALVLLAGVAAGGLLFVVVRGSVARKVSEEAAADLLRTAERRYRQLFTDLPLPTWVYDCETLRFLDVNGAAVRHYGWSREEFLTMTLRDIRPPEDVPAMLAGVADHPHTTRVFRHVRRDGSTIRVEITGHDFVLDGRPARLVVAHDVTERERVLAAQRKVEARFARLSDSGIIGVTVASGAGTFVEANDAFLRMTGYARADLEDGRLGWEILTAPEWRAGNVDVNAQLLELGFAGPIEKEYVRKDGSLLQALVGMAFIEGGYVIAFVLDVSERKRLEQVERAARELEEESRRAHEASRLKSEFLANMSHELRTPLNAIVGFTEMLHDGEIGPVSEAQKECLGDVLSSSLHLLQLINDVLDLAKVEAGKLEFRLREVRLPALVSEVVSTLRAPLDEKQLSVREEVQPGIEVVRADEVRLKQVLYNYLSNAIKFSKPGGEIAVRARAEGPRNFRLEVEDHGIGIRDEDLGRLFVTFQQLDSGTAKKHGGTGLGLALTRRLVEAQGGAVGVRSVYGSGSVFHAVLPRGIGEGSWQARPS